MGSNGLRVTLVVRRVICLSRATLALVVLVGPETVQAQPITYSISGVLTSIPSCVSSMFSVDDPWNINIVMNEEQEVQETEKASVVIEGGLSGESEGDIGSGEDNTVINQGVTEAFVRNRVYAASSFWWRIGDVFGTADGVTRVFVIDDSRDGIAWQALSYSASFSPPLQSSTGILGIQAVLVDSSGLVLDSLDLPKVSRFQFDQGFFRLMFRSRCAPFGHDSLDGSVVSVGPVIPYLR